MTVLKVATCQYPVSADTGQNASWMTAQMEEAARLGARVAHFHAANASPERLAAIGPGYAPLNLAATLTYPAITMPAVMTASAACNNMWISCPNSSAPESMWPACFVRSDGITTGRLERNVPGVLVSAVDTDQDLYDSTGPWRRRAIAGTLHSGELAEDDY